MGKESEQSVLGVENNFVRLSDHNLVWSDLYREEEKRIRSAIGHLIIDLQHIGSTSIPGIKAKPILDMLAGVAQFRKAVCAKHRLRRSAMTILSMRVSRTIMYSEKVRRAHTTFMWSSMAMRSGPITCFSVTV